MKFTFGPEVKLDLMVNTGDWRQIFSVEHIYRWHMQSEFYATQGGASPKATWIDAGQHVLLKDIYRIRFPMPPVPYVEWPEPPGFSKEKERCQYIRPGASPAALELCVAMAAKAEIAIQARILANGLKGTDESDQGTDTWPGVEGKVEPQASLVGTAEILAGNSR